MTEDEYCAGEFTDAELNCQADITDNPRAVEELFFEHHMDQQTRAAFRLVILTSHDRRHSILRAMQLDPSPKAC